MGPATKSETLSSSSPDGPGARRAIFSGSAFALGNSLQRAFLFLLLPVYTAALTPDEYGRLGLLITIQGGVSIALSAGMEAGVYRHYFHLEGDPNAQLRFVNSAWRLLMCGAFGMAVLAAGILVLFVPASQILRPDEAAIAVLAAATLVAATIVPLNILRAENRLRDYLILTSISGALTVILTVIFVVVIRLGVTGWLLGTLIANSLTLVAALYIVPWSQVEEFDRVGVRRTLSIGLPLIPHALSHWSLVLLDRAMLAVLVVPAALGIYTLASNLALPALVLVMSLNQGFMPSYARAHLGPNPARELRASITAQVAIVFFVGCSLALLTPLVVALTSQSYAEATPLIPWLVLGYVFLGLYYIPINGISLIVGRTTFVWVFTVFSAATNLALIYFLVPQYGLEAAAIASAVGYGVLFTLISIYAVKLSTPLRIDWVRVMSILAVFSLTYLAAITVGPQAGPSAFALRCLLLLLAAACTAYLCGLRVGELLQLVRRFQLALK